MAFPDHGRPAPAPASGFALLALISTAGLALRLGFVHAIGFQPGFFDVDGYHAMALAAGNGASVPTSHHPPGYAWFLWLVYEALGVRPRIVYLLQAVLGAGAALLAGDSIRRVAGTSAGALAAALLAFNAYAVLATSTLASENLALPGVALVLWLSLDGSRRPAAWRLLSAALVVSGLALVRTGLVLLAVPLAILVLLPRPARCGSLSRRLAASLGVVLVAFSGLFLHAVSRWRTTGVFRIGCPNDVYNLWVGNNPDATGRIDPMPVVPGVDLDKEAQARLLAPRVRAFLRDHPLQQVRLFLARASYNFAPPKRDLIYVYGHGWAGERPRSVVLATYATVALSLPILLAVALLAFARSGHLPAFRLAAALTAAVLLPYQVSIGDPRFLLPAYPALCAAAGLLGASRVPAAWSRGRRIVAALAMALFCANAARDLSLTDPALRAVSGPGGSRLRPPYHFAR